MRTGFALAMVMVTAAAVVSGCGQTASVQGKPAGEGNEKAVSPSASGDESKRDAPNDGWWCKEHGVPEGECALCSADVAAEFKKKGDWCKEHDRPESQCFICHPELADKFAARYEAKYGKKPPAREE